MIMRTRGRLGEQSTHVGIKKTLTFLLIFSFLSSKEDRDGFDATIDLKDDFTLSGCNSRLQSQKRVL